MFRGTSQGNEHRMSQTQPAFPSFAPLPTSIVFRFLEERNKYDFQVRSTAAEDELVVRVLSSFREEQTHLRGLLPLTSRDRDLTSRDREPAWWCWRQDHPQTPIIPCPVPLPDDLPPSAVLWTQWAGAAWHPEWLGVGQRGAIRWARTI